MKKALVVGINHYQNTSSLFGCVNDAHSVKTILARHSDGSVNFDVKLMACSDQASAIKRGELKDIIQDLFTTDCDTALFYFAGHGHIEFTGGYLLTSEAQRGDAGVSLGEVLALANSSRARNRIIILDACHSGIAGTLPGTPDVAQLNYGMTILTASSAEQYASEENDAGVFTTLLVDALNGAAANLVGEITPGSVYAHIDQSLGQWEQRPVFKTNVKSFISLRKVQPPISLDDLRRIKEFFPEPGFHYQLNPSFEPEPHGRPAGAPDPNPEHTAIFRILQKYNRVNLLVPVDAPHMWHAAMESKSCRLTVLGEHYRRLVERGRI